MLSVLLALFNSLYASYVVQRGALLHQTLESNRVYAAKLASVTSHLLSDANHLLSYSVDAVGGHLDDQDLLIAEATRLRHQSQHFDSVLFLRADGWVAAVAPRNPDLADRRLDTPYTREILKLQQPHISQPFRGATGRWLVSLSYPVFDEEDRYQGAVVGSIFLHDRNVLARTLGQHYYRDGSYLYVVDRKGVVLYHPDTSRIGKTARYETIARAATSGVEGELRAIDANGVEMLAGFAWVNNANWGVVAQRPATSTLSMVDNLMWSTIRNAVPLLILLLLCVWWMSRLIAEPLWQLARIATDMEKRESAEQVSGVKSWYFEASQLKRALASGLTAVHDTLQNLRRESATDPLTGLTNRRGLTQSLQSYLRDDSRYAVLALDIDHFKQVNDTYGHDTGDRLLQHVAAVMRQSCRATDLPCRVGGEEFLMILPDTSLRDATAAAQRVHDLMAERSNPTGAPVTLSIGVSHYPETSPTTENLLKQADAALYEAKRGGRNRSVVAATLESASPSA